MNAPSVKALDTSYNPIASTPFPVLVQSEEHTLLYFLGSQEPAGNEERVVAVFTGCLATRFGYPNDEALGGHPLFKAGLGFYGFFEVHNSPWMQEVRSQNRVCFPDYDMPARRHIIITFHDDTFECLADDFHIKKASEIPLSNLIKF